MMILTIFILITAGLIDGILEGYGFDSRKSFERKFGVSPISYAGSQSWKLAYKNNDVEQGFKSPFVEWMGAWDFYHHADDARKLFYILGGAMIMRFDFPLVVLVAAAFIVAGVAKWQGVKWVRK